MQIYYEDDQACLFDPESFHGENVPGAFSSGDPPARTSGSSLRRLTKICVADICSSTSRREISICWWIRVGDTLSVGWRVLDAQHWGLSQRRAESSLSADFWEGTHRTQDII